MIRYGKLLREFRNKRKLRQTDVAKANSMSNFSYSSIERGHFTPNAPTVKALLNSSFYTKKELEKLNKLYNKIVKERAVNKENKEYFKKLKEEKEKNIKRRKKERKEERLIRNNPNFYKKLNKLGDLSKVDINNSKLQDIRELVSGKRYWKGE